MSALQIENLLPYFGDLNPRVVQRWVAAALAQAAALREHDGWLYPTDPSKQATAERLHGAWCLWADDAEALLYRAQSVSSGGQAVAGLDELRDAVGRARAILGLPPALIARRREQAMRGEVHPIEEVRRELRDRVRG